MKKKILITLSLLTGLILPLAAQVSIYQDCFVGGVTGAGFTPPYYSNSPSPGTFTIHIPAGSTIHKALFIAGQQGACPTITVTLNGSNYTFDNTNQVSPTFQSAFYGGNSGVHAIDLTGVINPTVTTYNIVIPAQPSGPTDVFTDFYLYVAYDNPTLQAMNTAVFVNDQDMEPVANYTFNLTAPALNTSDIGVALFNGYACGAGDGSVVSLNGNTLGNVYGPDANSTSSCGGPMGCFYYENGTLHGLSDDLPDQAMNGPDALSNAQAIIPNMSSSYTMNFTHGNQDNVYWAWFVTYKGSNSTPVTAAFNASPDTGCAPASIIFNNTSGGATAYHWSFGDGSTDTTQSPTHIYSNVGIDTVTLIVTSIGGCASGSDTIVHTVMIIPPPTVNLGNDTSLCLGQNLTLNAGNPGSVYAWSTGATTQTINVTATGNYWVVIGIPGCTATDTIAVTFIAPPNVNLGSDIDVCTGVPVTLDAGNAGATYVWSTGETTQSITPFATGTYSVIASFGICSSVDTIKVTFEAIPVVNLGPDLTLCTGQTALLDAGNQGAVYHWSNAATTQSIIAAVAGTYWVQVLNGTCPGSDTMTIIMYSEPIVNIGPDIKLCFGETVTLDAGNPGMDFNWSTGEVAQLITVTTSGKYFVRVSNHGCVASDTANIFINKKLIVSLGKDTFLCPGDEMIIAATRGYAEYFWNPDGPGATFKTINSPGTYSVTVTDTNGCTATADMLVREFCPSDMFIPSAFTANGNGMNDIFMAYCDNVIDFHMYIFNRWGELVFESTDIGHGWDGTYNGADAPQGLYVYRVDYQLLTYLEQKKYSKVGNVNLIR